MVLPVEAVGWYGADLRLMPSAHPMATAEQGF